MPGFVHLHNHSDFSLLRASSTVGGLVKSAQALGMSSIALTDDGNLFGALKFYKEAKATKDSDKPVKPIIGCDFFMSLGNRHEKGNNENANRYHRIVLLAASEKGYRNLCKLSSLGYTEGFYYRPRIDKEILAQYKDGLIALSGGVGGEIPQLLSRNRHADARASVQWYKELFGPGKFYLELTDHGIPEQKVATEGLLGFAKEFDLPLVATNDTYYLEKKGAFSHDVLLCIGGKRKKHEANRFKFSSEEFYLKSEAEMAVLFGHIPGALENTVKIAEACDLELQLPGPLLPDFPIPEGFSSPSDYLRHLGAEGLKKRYGQSPSADLVKRLNYELDVIIKMGFEGYFLIVWDFIRYAKENGIPVGPGRGSGAGSIVAYSMDITDIDPMKYSLLFERFLNPDRVSMPDFDIDFCFERRQEVIDYVTRKYGSEKVGQIITFGTLKPKAVTRDVARVMDLSFAEADVIAKLIPEDPKIHLKDLLKTELDDETRNKFKENGWLENSEKLKGFYRMDDAHKDLFDAAIGLEGLSRHASTHAAGIVIGKEELTNYVPLFKDPKSGAISTQFTMDMLEECGLVKMDFLGLKTLTLVQNTEALVRKTANPDFSIEKAPEDDALTFKMLGDGHSSAVFQFDGDGMQKTLKEAKPTCIEDLIALNALYRPGPMDNIPQFIEGKKNGLSIKYPHKDLEDILKETYGVIVYQEQVMQVAQIIAGYSLGKADLLRRAMGKKKKEILDKEKEPFLQGAVERGYSREKANEIFEILVPFAGYGFNKSHAAAYSVLAYKTAYLKANYPAQFMAANLTNEINSPDKFRLYLSETRSMGIEVNPPDINVSDRDFTVSEGHIVFGLMGIKGIGEAVVEEIISSRQKDGPFASIEDFLERLDLRTVNRKAVEILIQAGCFDHVIPGRGIVFKALDSLLALATAKKDGKKFGQTGLFDDRPEEEFPAVSYDGEDYDITERLKLEKELLGNYFSGHPLDAFAAEWERSTTLDLSKPENTDSERKYSVVAMLSELRVLFTRKGTRMGIARFEDYNGSIEAVFFSEALEKFEEQLVLDKVMGLICKVDLSRGAPQLIIEDIRQPGELEERDAGEVHIKIRPEFVDNEDALYELRSQIFSRKGACPVFVHMPDRTVIRVSGSITINSRQEILGEIRKLDCVAEIWKKYPAMASSSRARYKTAGPAPATAIQTGPGPAAAGRAYENDSSSDDGPESDYYETYVDEESEVYAE